MWDQVVVVFGAEFEFELFLFFGIVGADIMHCRSKYIIICQTLYPYHLTYTHNALTIIYNAAHIYESAYMRAHT